MTRIGPPAVRPPPPHLREPPPSIPPPLTAPCSLLPAPSCDPPPSTPYLAPQIGADCADLILDCRRGERRDRRVHRRRHRHRAVGPDDASPRVATSDPTRGDRLHPAAVRRDGRRSRRQAQRVPDP